MKIGSYYTYIGGECYYGYEGPQECTAYTETGTRRSHELNESYGPNPIWVGEILWNEESADEAFEILPLYESPLYKAMNEEEE